MAGLPDALDRIGKLIRLATNNPNEQEAMRAALQACKLLVQHRCDISLPHAKPKGTSFDDVMDKMRETQRRYEQDFAARERKRHDAVRQAQQDFYERVQRDREETERRRQAERERERDERAQEWAEEMKKRAKKPAQGHAWDPHTMRCQRCGVTQIAFQQLGGNMPCYG
jgi:hypothetical protein